MSPLTLSRSKGQNPWVIGVLVILCALFVSVALGSDSADAKTKCTQKGTKGIDVLKGTKHRDVLCGLGGNDVLLGKGGNDILKGGGGTDTLLGGDGADKLIAGGGPDSLTGGKGSDKLIGQGGSDTVSFADAPGAVVVDMPGHTATGIGKDHLSGDENVIGSPANDTITGSSKANEISAGAGNDLIAGGGGDDVMDGESGSDTITYAASTTAIAGGLDSGSMSGQGNDSVSGIETVIGSPHDDSIVGSDGNDTISGGGGDDQISGGAGDDLINGDAGNDKIYGEDANDSLHGDDGDDLIDGGAGVNACDGGTGSNTFAGNCDTGPPILSDVRINPQSVDTFSASQPIQFRLDVSDDLSGVDVAQSKVIIRSPSGAAKYLDLTQISGNQSVGTLGADFDLPRYAAEGTYTIDALLVDNSANSVTVTSSQLISSGYDGSFTQTGQGDSEAPHVAGLTVNPVSVDTSQASKGLHFTVHATDDLAGVDAGESWVAIIGPDGNERDLTYLADGPGTPLSGDFTGDITLPRYSPQGTYTLLVKLVDSAGNEAFTTSTQLVSSGYTGTFSQTGAGDTDPPQLLSFLRSPATTDTREGAQTLNITVGASDALAGVDPAASTITVRDPNGRVDSTTPLSANGTNSFTAAPVLGRGSAPGIWKVDLTLVDKAGNTIVIPSARLAELGFQATFQNLGVQGT